MSQNEVYIIVKKEYQKAKRHFFWYADPCFYHYDGTLCSTWQNSRVYESEQLDRVGYGDVTSWIIEQPGVEELIDQIEELRGTEKTERQKIKQVLYKAGKKQTQNNGMLAVYEPENYDYYIYKEDLTGIQKNPKEPKDGEMYVSRCME